MKKAIKNLPKDLAETYVRIFEAIPEPDRPVVRRVLIWICGHADAPWLTDVGINANVLLPAALYDVYGRGFETRAFLYDWEYLQYLCGCLITSEILTSTELKNKDGFLREESLEPSPDCCRNQQLIDHQIGTRDNQEITLVRVSLAHYTVKEFLASAPILQSSVSYFAMSDASIGAEFAAAIVRQALEADPDGTATDWVTDREAYCLTLVPACQNPDPAVRRSLLKYFDPSEPHFARIAAIQRRLMEMPDKSHFYIEILAIQVQVVGDLEPQTRRETTSKAGILLNMMMVNSDDLLEGHEGFDMEKLLNTEIIVTYIEPDDDEGHPKTTKEVKVQGTIPQVIRA